jgi:hypothetical protein
MSMRSPSSERVLTIAIDVTSILPRSSSRRFRYTDPPSEASRIQVERSLRHAFQYR